ncbi:ribosomal protein L4 [Annulohypoxylon maeteangense]|uniref:ribosomal protein L4 n=1 Tax=Annulohypoxylon maeteangense TaxID=1927788 RepID=UPI0020079975|nr:ribosomal protein L4 [Annulohypoxylon maeteangense]KAI0881039.1 ribosomal protein L4 [Annulohypoxylon maeteangense]
MASKGVRGLNEALRSLTLSSQTCREAVPHRIPSSTFTRSMATEAPLPKITTSASTDGGYKPITTVPLTIFNFPSFEPARLESWSAKHLFVPLRRDILHLAVIYEGDNTRQGTASSKTRWDVAGSHRKVRPQKGTGGARQGSRQSPLMKGGGKSFGPHPRDFGTKITRKVYDLAWRTALSYRYRRGELVVCEDGMEMPMPEEYYEMVEARVLNEELRRDFRSKWARQVLDANDWGRANGRSTFITTTQRENLSATLAGVPNWGRALDVADVDVKDLLETGRLVVEREALKEMIIEHQSDLVTKVFVENVRMQRTPESGMVLVE